jgi:archaellum biogenesis ATPase FlaH
VVENKIISTICSSRESFLKLQSVVDLDTFTEYGKKVYKEILDYYKADKNCKKVDLDLVRTRILELEPKKAGLVSDYFANLPEASSADNILRLYQEQAKAKIREELILALSSNNEHRIKNLFDEYLSKKPEEELGEIYNGISIEDLSVQFNRENLIPIYPTPLNEALGGGVPRQSQICIYARPDVGKTTVAINLAVGAAENGFRVAYLGNEDPSAVMVLRAVSRFTRRPVRDILGSKREAYREALANGYQNLFFISAHPGTPSELRKYVEKIKPDLLVIDQIRNMHFKPESMTVNLEQGVIFTRNLAKEFNLVSCVITQAGNSASNKINLSMEDVEWSNTGVAAQQDLMLAVGQNEMMKENRLITISFPKNKLTAPIKPMMFTIDYELNRLSVPK